MKTRAEAEQALAADPIHVDEETRTVLVNEIGEAAFKKLRTEHVRRQAHNIKVTSGAPAWIDLPSTKGSR